MKDAAVKIIQSNDTNELETAINDFIEKEVTTLYDLRLIKFGGGAAWWEHVSGGDGNLGGDHVRPLLTYEFSGNE